MGGLRAYYEQVPSPVVYTAGLAAVGLGYPVLLALTGTLPPLAELQPSLATGILLGFAVDRFLGDRGLVALIEGERSGSRWGFLRARLIAVAPLGLPNSFGLLDRAFGAGADLNAADRPAGTGSSPGTSRGNRPDAEDGERGDADDDDSGVGWWALFSLVSTLGFSSVLQLTTPWIVGLVLGLLWFFVAVRLVRLCSPFSEGMNRPPRGVPPEAIERSD